MEILGRNVCTNARDNTLEPLVGEVVAQFDISNLPISSILDLAIAEVVVPSLTVGYNIGTGTLEI
jgi:hypothetical protein